jgi:hypothetical protein
MPIRTLLAGILIIVLLLLGRRPYDKRCKGVGSMTKVKLVKLILPKAEIEKLTPKDKKRYVMFTSMLRDLNLLQNVWCSLGM